MRRLFLSVIYLWSLFLVLVSSAQVTYQGDFISSRHAESQQNNSVSANIRLSFRVKPRAALVIHDGTSFTDSPMFDPSRLISPSILSFEEGQTVSLPSNNNKSFLLNSSNSYSNPSMVISGELYASTAFRLDFGKYEPIKLVHEFGEINGIVDCLFQFSTELGELNFNLGEQIIVDGDLNETGTRGILAFVGVGTIDPTSIGSIDRSGNYYGTYTITTLIK